MNQPPQTTPENLRSGEPRELLVARHSLLRRTATAHPLPTYLVAMFAITWAILFPLTLNGLPPEPGLIAVVLFAQLGPACLVTAAEGGRPAVRSLLSRTFRWRVHPVWYLIAGFTLPGAVIVSAVLVRGSAAWQELTHDRGLMITYLLGFLIVPLINLWEETGWMGMVQSRLQAARGPLRGAAITGILFATLHIPLMVGSGGVRGFALTLALTLAFAVPFRMVLGWLHNNTGGSVLIVAIAHASFNSSNDSPLTLAMWPHAWPTTVVPAVLAVAATVLVVATKGRLGAGRGEPR